MRISKNQEKVLRVLGDIFEQEANCMFFRYIAKEADLDERIVRIACRALARKGLAEYVRGLIDEDGLIAGSGYCATKEGALVFYSCKECKKEVADMTDGTCLACYEKINHPSPTT